MDSTAHLSHGPDLVRLVQGYDKLKATWPLWDLQRLVHQLVEIVKDHQHAAEAMFGYQKTSKASPEHGVRHIVWQALENEKADKQWGFVKNFWFALELSKHIETKAALSDNKR